MTEFSGVAWKNRTGHTPNGQGYGIKIPSLDVRHEHFRREWGTGQLLLEGAEQPVTVNVDKDSFWNATCGELISAKIGRWLFARRLAPWPAGKPPHFRLRPTALREFEVTSLT